MTEAAQRDSLYGPDDRPDLATLLRLFGRSLKLGIHTCIPGSVKLVRDQSPSKPLMVDVQPGFQAIYLDGEGNDAPKSLPIIRNAVVGHFAGGGFKAGVKPLVGDHGWLIFCERALERWLGKGNVPVDPVWSEVLGMNGAMFLPVGPPGPAGLQLDDDFVIADTAGLNEVRLALSGEVTVKAAVKVVVEAPVAEVEAPSIKLGSAAASLSATLADTLIGVMDTAITAAVAAALPIVPPSGDGGTAAFTAFQTAWNSAKNSIKALRVKVQ